MLLMAFIVILIVICILSLIAGTICCVRELRAIRIHVNMRALSRSDRVALATTIIGRNSWWLASGAVASTLLILIFRALGNI